MVPCIIQGNMEKDVPITKGDKRLKLVIEFSELYRMSLSGLNLLRYLHVFILLVSQRLLKKGFIHLRVLLVWIESRGHERRLESLSSCDLRINQQ